METFSGRVVDAIATVDAIGGEDKKRQTRISVVSPILAPPVKRSEIEALCVNDQSARPVGRDPSQSRFRNSLKNGRAFYPAGLKGIGKHRREIHEGRPGSPDRDLSGLPERSDENEAAHQYVVWDGTDAHMNRGSKCAHHRACVRGFGHRAPS